MNDVTPTDDDSASSSGEDDDDFGAVPKSHSTPNLAGRRRREAVMRSVSNVGDASNLRASEIRQKDAESQPADSSECASMQTSSSSAPSFLTTVALFQMNAE